jgi:preprotein translocase subunit Sss1
MTDTGPSTATTRTARRPVQTAALVVSAVFVLVGILGFVPGVTTDYDQLAAAGHHSGALLLGVFAVSVLHNLVHLAFGVVGFLLARTAVLWLYGLLIDRGSDANFVPVNTADNWLHLGLAVVMIALGVALGRSGRAVRA